MQYVLVLEIDDEVLIDDSIEYVCSLLNGRIVGNDTVENNAIVQDHFSVRPLSEVIAS